MKKANKKSMWFRDAAENPFEKKDDKGADKPEEKKDDKKSPFPPKKEEKKDDKPEEKKDDKKPSPPKKDAPKDDKKPAADGDKAKEALKLLEDLKKDDKLEIEDHESLDEMIEMLKDIIDDESGDDMPHDLHAPKAPAAPGMPGLKPMKMEVLPGPAKPPMPGMPGKPPAMAPKSMASWAIENAGETKIGDRVWPVEALGNLGHVGDEPGRVTAVADDGMLSVDWGDEMPTVCDPSEVVSVRDIAGQDALFSEAEFDASSNEAGMDVGSIPEELFSKDEAEAVLSTLSLKDMLGKSEDLGPDAIVHLASGKIGKFISTASDGRCLVKFDDRDVYVWPHEFKYKNSSELFAD